MDRVLTAVLNGLLTCGVLFEVGLLAVNIVVRALGHPIVWVDEASQLPLYCITFVGAATAYRSGRLIAVDAVVRKLNGSVGVIFRAAAEIIVATISILGCLSARPILKLAGIEDSPILGISLFWFYLPLSIGFGLLAYYALRRLVVMRWRVVALAAAGLAVLASLSYALFMISDRASFLLGIGVLSGLALCIVTGAPLAIAFICGSMIYFAGSGSAGQSQVANSMLSGSNGTTLLAIPLFILAGWILGSTGISTGLLRLASIVLNKVRGGLLMACVGAMYIFSGISGSKLADVAAVSSAVSGAVDESEYSREEFSGVMVASSVMGEAVPPSIALIILASVTELPVLKLFLAGLLPALVIGVSIAALIYIRARKHGWRGGGRFVNKGGGEDGLLKACAESTVALIVMMVIVGGIGLGLADPTDAGAIACVASAIGAVVLRSRADLWRSVSRIAVDTVEVTGFIMFTVAAASVLSYALTISGFITTITAKMSVDDNKLLFVLISLAVLPVIGLMLEGLPAILIAAPALVPVAEQLGVNGVRYGVLLVLALGLGSFLPPFGVGYVATCAVVDIDPNAARRVTALYLMIALVGICVVAFVPGLGGF